MTLAVIKTGGKQYLVSPGQKIKIEKIDPEGKPPRKRTSSLRDRSVSYGADKKDSKEIVFNEVLLLENGKKLEVGNPLVKGAKVIGKILKHGKNKKVIVFKYKAKTRYKVKKGHRQPFIEVEIVKISNS